MIKICVTILSSTLFFSACAKESKSVADPGPNFSVGSLEVKMATNGPNATAIHRDEPTSGPQIQIQISDGSLITSIERKLTCGPVTLLGRKVSSGDVTMMNFRLAEEEFPGLAKMPSVSKCKLAIIATNNIGSTTTKIIPVTLTFDKNPQIEINRQVATVGLNPYNESLELILESYVIKNNLPYPITLMFTPKRQVSVLPKVSVGPPADLKTAPSLTIFETPAFNIKATRIDIAGNAVLQTGNLLNEARVVIPPETSVTFVSYGQVPSERSQYACTQQPPTPFSGGTVCRTLKGINVIGISEPKQSLSILWGFESAPEDTASPNFIDFKEDHPLPGVTPATLL